MVCVQTVHTVDSAHECVQCTHICTLCPGSHHDFSHLMIQSFITGEQTGAGGRGVVRIIDLPDKITLLSTPSMGTVTVHRKKGDVKKEYCRKSALNKAGYLKV